MSKALLPMLVTLSGIVTLVRLLQLKNILGSMLVTLSGTVMLVRLLQREKAEAPMLVTLSGIMMFVRLLQEAKAPLPMLVTGLNPMVSGMTSPPVASSLQSVIVTSPLVVV